MERINNDYLSRHKKFRIDIKKLATAFFVLAFVVAIIVFWWLKLVGITVTGEAFCGLSEHTHSDDCYISELVCGFEDDSTTVFIGEADTTEASLSDETTSEAHTTKSGKSMPHRIWMW